MSSFEKMRNGLCPNDCGPLTILKRPIPKLHLVPEDLCDPLEGVETPEDMFGYITAICPECSFILGTPPTYYYNYDLGIWKKIKRQPSDEKPSKEEVN